ncbi:AAA domain-containing protein [Aquabacterium commune]|uniref:AAA domain-containing protein n=1 Tax=Aquabacterium commune TaxID=70586 RepID=A0A4R6RCE5_9BURK|nr:AAA domain-containing protein [Aquabacterium commune]TDP83792.1 AAA domain-containing protein [Aquabacterium commune]
MALLHYNNLDVARPDILLKNAFYGLKTFHDFLRRTKDYMEGDAAVKRLAWKAGTPPDDDQTGSPRGFWIQLEEPRDRPNEPESTFRAFMDENVRDVFERIADDPDASADRRSTGRKKFADDRRLNVLDRDPETSQLLVDRRPKGEELLLRPNTLTLLRQAQALQALQNAPLPSHRPLLRLTESTEHARWPSFEPARIESDGWMVLTDEMRPGTDEQRRFVQIALATPDFVLLEGPPGSGKTTAICELVLQLARQGKRALLCASTHVAVDNVLERLMDERNLHRDLVIPVRIGERRNVSEKAAPWQLERFVKTERERLLRHLDGRRGLSDSQQALLEELRNGPTAIERMVLDAANLVCGTTIGILQHPDIKASGHAAANFDVLIVDEASKTTFQEFLVPALLAKRWVVVGDPKQLSPYVDDAAMAVNVEACLGDEHTRNACIDVFMASQEDPRKRRVAVVSINEAKAMGVYAAQAAARGVVLADASNDAAIWSAAVVAGAATHLERRIEELPLDVATVRHAGDGLATLRRRADAWLRISGREREEQPEWAAEIAWRIARLYEQRFAHEIEPGEGKRRSTSHRLRNQIEQLLPASDTGADTERVWGEIDRVRRVALPSILESLRQGFERDPQGKKPTALSDGLPASALRLRHVLLSTQHRMHPEIAAFPHEHIYAGEALFTPEHMADERAWSFRRHAHRAVWLDVRGSFNGRFNSNSAEATAVIDELKAFDTWAAQNPRRDGQPWEAAVLTFYRGQEREIRSHLRRWTQHGSGMRHFTRGPKAKSHLTIELCTVDRFQGHEADLVILSFASARPTSFLETPNRLNVALTRARYQRIVVGDRHAMKRAQPSVLGVFAEQEVWDAQIKKAGGTHAS